MSKSEKPPKRPPTPLPSDPVENPEQPVCWDFEPVDIAVNGSELKAGDSITGSHVGNRILINSNRKAIGFVPDKIIVEIRKYLGSRPRRLVGQVLYAGEERILLELCAL